MKHLKIIFSREESESLTKKGFRNIELGNSTAAVGYFYVVSGRYDHDSIYPNLTISVSSKYLDELCKNAGVSIPASAYLKTYPGEMGALGQYYPGGVASAYRFKV